ncbi:MAG: hypothetical protein KDE22_07955, partial [Rhodobacterales bacterium]|nr:hypothetical protein [Rhodobacterales bacterium]
FDADQMTNWYRWRRWRDSLPRWERFRRWRKSVPEPDFPFFINCHAWYVQPSPYAFTCVTAKDIGIEALGREINDYWVALIKPYVEQGRTLRGYADRFYPSRSDGHPLASDLMMLWIAGNKDKFYSEVNRAIEDARMSIHDIYKEEFKGFWGVHDLIFQKKEKIRMVKVLYRGAQRHNRDIKKLMKFLGA